MGKREYDSREQRERESILINLINEEKEREVRGSQIEKLERERKRVRGEREREE